ncbi:MAG: GyrI-like domain-containing protein [Dehalococcoidia bacterium]
MSSPIVVTIKQVNPVTVAFLSVTGHYSQIPTAFDRLYGWINQKGYQPHGPAITVWYNIPGEVPDNELHWEVRSALSGDVIGIAPDPDNLGVKRLDAAQVATTMHKGPYDGVEKTYKALIAWVAANGYEIIGPPEELYYNEPAKTPPGELLTEIRFPVCKK